MCFHTFHTRRAESPTETTGLWAAMMWFKRGEPWSKRHARPSLTILCRCRSKYLNVDVPTTGCGSDAGRAHLDKCVRAAPIKHRCSSRSVESGLFVWLADWVTPPAAGEEPFPNTNCARSLVSTPGTHEQVAMAAERRQSRLQPCERQWDSEHVWTQLALMHLWDSFNSRQMVSI